MISIINISENNIFFYFKIILFVLFIFFFDLGIDNPDIYGISFDYLDIRISLLILIPIFFFRIVKFRKKL